MSSSASASGIVAVGFVEGPDEGDVQLVRLHADGAVTESGEHARESYSPADSQLGWTADAKDVLALAERVENPGGRIPVRENASL